MHAEPLGGFWAAVGKEGAMKPRGKRGIDAGRNKHKPPIGAKTSMGKGYPLGFQERRCDAAFAPLGSFGGGDIGMTR